MEVVVQRPLESRNGSWNIPAGLLVDAELRPLGKGWHVVESLRPKGQMADDKPRPVLHRGFFDSHLHVTWLGLMEMDLDLRSMTSPHEVIAAVRERADSGASVIRAYGWDESRFGLSLEGFEQSVAPRLPEAPPVVLYRVCGHSALVNAALKAAARLPGPSGLVTDRELSQLGERIPPHSLDELHRAFLIGQRRLLDSGVTAVGDMSLDDNLVSVIRSIAAAGELKMDVMGVCEGGKIPAVERSGPFGIDNKSPVGPLDRAARFTVQHWKKYLDGSFGSRTAWLTRDYDDFFTRGDSLISTVALLEQARQALFKGFQLSFHAIGDAALDQVLEVGQKLAELLEKRERFHESTLPRVPHRIEHAQLIRDDQLDRLESQRHWALCVQPNHRLADEPFSRARLGPARLRQEAYRLGSLKARGIPVALSSDAPVDAPDPERVLRAACSHENPAERLGFYDAVWLYTTGSRLNLGLDPGRLGVGSTVRLTDPAVIL